jgi:hypothetical protein
MPRRTHGSPVSSWRAAAGHVCAQDRVGDSGAVLVGEALPDRRDGDLGVRFDHRVDVTVQTVQGGGFAVGLLARWRVGGGKGLDDSAAADVVLALDRPAGHAVAGVAADRGVLGSPGFAVPLDVFFCVTPCRMPDGGG